MAGMPTTDTPEWVRHAVFYQIFPDRFGHSERVPKAGHLEPWQAPPSIHGYEGGDLLAVVERLDYLKDLGVTALYLNPVFQSASNHRYHTHDYFRVDPMLGGDAALEALIAALHGRGMRLILDGVFNMPAGASFHFPMSSRTVGTAPTRTGSTSTTSHSTPTGRASRATKPGGTCPPCPSSTPVPPRCASSCGG